MLKIKNKRLFKAVFSVFMVVVICLATMGSVPIKVYSAYIDPALEKILSRAEDTDLIPVDIWLYEIDTEEVDEKVFAKTGLSRETISDEKRSAELTHEQVDAYIEAERELYAEAQTKRSNEFLKQYSNIFTSKATENSEIFYVSKYAPSIQMELTPAQIAKLAKDLSVESIYYSPEGEEFSDSNVSFPVVGANYTRDTLGLTGTGVKIGILEATGLPERGNYNIPRNKIVFDPNVDKTVFGEDENDRHASKVASIIMGEYDGNYEGIVPDAYVYATYTCDVDGYETTWKECIEWLISRGVNIINMSMGFYGNNGSYNSKDRWADHVALQHNVHIIKSAGNIRDDINPQGYISSPGLAYNVITVGNLNINNSPSLADDVIDNLSAYVEIFNAETPNKPDVVAPGTGTATGADVIGGTSAAAPHVTGIVAQLCQADTYLKTNPAAMKAILCATTVTSQHSYCPTDENEYNKYGAGLISAQQSYNTVINERYLSGIFYPEPEAYAFQNHTITLNSNKQRLRIALTWLNYKYISNDDHSMDNPSTANTMADLDLRIYSPTLNEVFESNIGSGNVEIIDINYPPADDYVVEVVAYTGSTQFINYSIAWWYE